MRRNLKRKQPADEAQAEEVEGDGKTTPSTRTPKKRRIKDLASANDADEADDGGSPTPRANGVLKTPTKPKRTHTPSAITKKADRSAKRKSATTLLEYAEAEEDGGFETAIAQEILEEDNEEDDEEEEEAEGEEGRGGGRGVERCPRRLLNDESTQMPQQETPSKRGRGRPKGSKNRRSPTPEGDIAPEERYFFQNRSGPPEVSNNTLGSLKLLTHDEYLSLIRGYRDPHEPEVAYLARLHARAFPQWRFEWHQGFNICLYGWGSKRQLVSDFAEWLYPKYNLPPKIVVVNGYIPKLHIRTVLNTLITTAMGQDAPNRLGSQPAEMLDLLLSHLNRRHATTDPPIMILFNSIDAGSLRRQSVQTLLARLAAHPSIYLLATADTPSFPLLWDGKLCDQFAFAYHDCTTYAPYTAELNVVDDVHELLGRKGRRAGGGDGVGFVLKSLTENSRKLYRLLLMEILDVLADGMLDDGRGRDVGEDEQLGREGMKRSSTAEGRAHLNLQNGGGRGGGGGGGGEGSEGGEVGVEYKTLYQKASENFVCSSEMNFRTLLKEFYDHQMIVSRKESGGGGSTEILGVPLSREEMETLLEQLA